MIAVDTNILVYAHRRDSAWHDAAFARVKELAEDPAPWMIPQPCLHEFLAIVTHPRIYNPPSSAAAALDQVGNWLESPSLILQGESSRHWRTLTDVIGRAKIVGPAIHDGRIAAICLDHGVRVLWTADRDFSRFAGLRVENPLVNA